MLSTEQIILGITIAVIVCTTIAIIIVLLRPKSGPPTPPGPPNPSPSPPTNSYFKAYVEDCKDQPNSYNIQAIQNLEILGLDFSGYCYSRDKTLLNNLKNFKGKIFLHFDQTKDSDTCGNKPDLPSMDQSIFNACANKAKQELGDQLVQNINGVLWEKEGNKFVNACESENCKSAFSNAFNRQMLFAGWKFFGGAWESLPPNWDYQFIEMYNVYNNQCGACGGNNCSLDYNPLTPDTKKCPNNKTKYKFNPAVCGPTSSPGCVYGTEGMYSTAVPINQQAIYLAKIFKNQPKPKVPDPEKTVIFFPFTDASQPSFKNIITTEDQFNEFVQTFIDILKDTSPGIENCMYGAWGAPKWISS